MKVKQLARVKTKRPATDVIEFDSLNEFYKYITETKDNQYFEDKLYLKSSINGSELFTGTKDFKEAVELMKNGWSEMAKTLNQRIKSKPIKSSPVSKPRNVLGVCGYQAVVPLYLQGVPNNMVSKKMIPVKQKVITINKMVGYNCNVRKEQMTEESLKAFQIIRNLENQGYRCNLNVIVLAEKDKSLLLKVKIKSANEKLNVSKMAFPLVHPSFLRRMYLKFVEVYPEITSNYVYGYGRQVRYEEIQNDYSDCFDSNEYIIPNFITKDIDKINSLDDLKNL